jgi:hypothetical protein
MQKDKLKLKIRMQFQALQNHRAEDTLTRDRLDYASDYLQQLVEGLKDDATLDKENFEESAYHDNM